MVFDLSEVPGLIALLFYFGVISFAWLLPLKKYLGTWGAALKLSIPLSLSLQILFAYVFYTCGAVQLYPLFYLALVIVINIIVAIQLGAFRLPKLSRVLSPLTLFAGIFAWIAFTYTRFYNAFLTATPGAIDTFNHMRFIRDLKTAGHLSFPTYAPGFHLLVYPINLIIGDSLTYRFVGPVFGLLSGIALYLLFRSDLKNTSARLLIPALFCFPAFIPLSLPTISFFSTALSFILFPVMLSPVIHDYKRIGKGIYILALIPVLGLSLSVPYLFVQITAAAIVLLFCLYLFRSKIPSGLLKKIKMMSLMLVIGFCAALLHTYIQAKLYSATLTFPTVGLTEAATPSPTSTPGTIAVVASPAITHATTTSFVSKLDASPAYTDFIVPFLRSGWDIIGVKDIRPLNSLFSIGAYIWGFLSIGIFIWAMRRKFMHIALASYFCIFFTVITQTGILEISTYRGRTAWYLLLFTLLTLVFLFDKMKAAEKPAALLAPSLLGASGLFFPPVFYQPYPPHVFDVGYRVVQDAPSGDNIVFYADEPELSLLGNKITVVAPTATSIAQPCPAKSLCYVFIETAFHSLDPVLSQEVDSQQSNLAALNAQTAEEEADFLENKVDIESSPAFQEYHPVIEDSDLTVYQR